MSSFVLKLIAIITMLIDHTGAILFPNEQLFRIIGRIAFPIFVFLIVEGFHHTSDVKKYMTRLGVFALISEIPFDMAFYKFLFHGDILKDFQSVLNGGNTDEFFRRMVFHQNIFFTLFLGLVLIYFMSRIEAKYKKNVLVSNVLDGLLTIAFCGIALLLRTDYNIGGILLIVAFYLFRGSKALLAISLLIVSGTLYPGSIQIFSVIAVLPIAFYNGEKGRSAKYLFYIFYPAHLLVLYFIDYLNLI